MPTSQAISEGRSADKLLTQPWSHLSVAIEQRTATIGIVGLGYVGLPLARAFTDAGFATIGFDVDSRKIATLRRGETYIGHISDFWIQQRIDDGTFEPTDELSRLSEPDVLVICVPTPLTESREPDLTYVEATARQISQNLRPGKLVILESTTYPGTTRDVLIPILEESSLAAGKDFLVAYSPEREDPGNLDFSSTTIPKVVGGMDEQSQALAVELYSSAVSQVVPVSSCEVAEAAKILENTYRAVNIALVNELKVLLQKMGIDIWEVIEAAKTKPFGFQAFYPGPGLGGHCIPIDPFYLSWLARKNGTATRFIELAGEVNTGMPDYVVERITAALNDAGKPLRGSRIAILGVAYKKDIDDPRESPALKLMELLQQRGVLLSYSDPHIPALPSPRHYDVPRLASEPLTAEFLASQDCVVIATDHSSYDYEHVVRYAPIVVDTRNATAQITAGREKIYKA